MIYKWKLRPVIEDALLSFIVEEENPSPSTGTKSTVLFWRLFVQLDHDKFTQTCELFLETSLTIKDMRVLSSCQFFVHVEDYSLYYFV